VELSHGKVTLFMGSIHHLEAKLIALGEEEIDIIFTLDGD
jgi:hypothetical protein